MKHCSGFLRIIQCTNQKKQTIMERIENPMLSYRPEEEDFECAGGCGDLNPTNDVEVSIQDKKSNDYKDVIISYCDDCYNERFND